MSGHVIGHVSGHVIGHMSGHVIGLVTMTLQYLFSYKKPSVSCLSRWPWFNFNHTIYGMDISMLPRLQEFDQCPGIFGKLSIIIFAS